MTVHQIDNTVSDLKKVILWQYDKAYRLLSVIKLQKNYYDAAVTTFWNAWIKDVVDIDTCNDFGAGLWALILGVRRPMVSDNRSGSVVERPLSLRVYRLLLKATFFLLRHSMSRIEVEGGPSATQESYLKILFTVMDGENKGRVGVKVVDKSDMAMSYEKSEWFDYMDYDQKALYEQVGDSVLAYPIGIRYNERGFHPVFSFVEEGWHYTDRIYKPNIALSADIEYYRIYGNGFQIFFLSRSFTAEENTGWNAIRTSATIQGTTEGGMGCPFVSAIWNGDYYKPNVAYKRGDVVKYSEDDDDVRVFFEDVSALENTGWSAVSSKTAWSFPDIRLTDDPLRIHFT